MDHSGMKHGGMDHGNMCSMNMLFTWETKNLCIIFRGWQVTGTLSLIGTLMGIILLTAGYELVRELARRYETAIQDRVDSLPNSSSCGAQDESQETQNNPERRSLLWPAGRDSMQAAQKSKVVKAALYALQVFYSFFIMLLFMTYNGWVMIAVAVGAFIGFLVFGNASATKSAACH